MKVYVIMVNGKPHVFTSKSQLKRVVASLSLPFEPEVFECEVEKREYNKRTGVI